IKNFTQRSGVNYAAKVVDSLQTRKRRTGKAELRVKVVFKNKCVVSMREIEQCETAFETHCHSERVLMRRCHMDQFWLRFCWRSGDHNSLLIQRLGNHFGAG